MRSRILTSLTIVLLAAPTLSVAQDADALPNSVKTCDEARSYIDKDNSMTMDTFKKLMTAAGWDLDKGGNASLDLQCKTSAYVKNDIMVQYIFKKEDGSLGSGLISSGPEAC